MFVVNGFVSGNLSVGCNPSPAVRARMSFFKTVDPDQLRIDDVFMQPEMALNLTKFYH